MGGVWGFFSVFFPVVFVFCFFLISILKSRNVFSLWITWEIKCWQYRFAVLFLLQSSALNIFYSKNLLENAMAYVAKAYYKICKCFVSCSSRHHPISKPENCKCQLRLFLVKIFKLRPFLGKIACLLLYLLSQYLNTFMLERQQGSTFYLSVE